MQQYELLLTDWDLQVIEQMLIWGQLEILRQMKRLGTADYDLKEYYWLYRSGSNDIKRKIRQIRGYPGKL